MRASQLNFLPCLFICFYSFLLILTYQSTDQTTTILASNKYDVSEKSDLVVITAGVAQKPGESRLSLVERNAKIMGMIMPEVLKYSPNATILIVSNPCDIMTAIAAKIAGPNYPQGKIFGAGTNLDSSRFQCLIASSMDLVCMRAER